MSQLSFWLVCLACLGGPYPLGMLARGGGADPAAVPPAPAHETTPTTNSNPTANPTVRTNISSVDLVLKGNQAYRSGNRSNAISFFTQAITANPTNVLAYYNRGRIRDVEGDRTGALMDFDRLLSFAPNHMGTRQLRGQLLLRLGHVPQAITDFDEYIKLAPKAEERHWQRGIAYYLAGRYEEGIRQFALCAATTTNDMENALWHFACATKANGGGKTRSPLLKVGLDPRKVLRDLYGFYEGRVSLDGVLMLPEPPGQKGDSTNPEERMFLRLYYLGLYFDATGELSKAVDYLAKAVDIRAPNSLMIDVARVQLSARRLALPSAGASQK